MGSDVCMYYMYYMYYYCVSRFRFPGNMSFAHLVCAINPGAVNRLLMNYNPERNGLWTSKDNKG